VRSRKERQVIEEAIDIGLVLERRVLDGPWGGYVWRPVAVFPQAPDVAPWTSLGGAGPSARWYAGLQRIHLYSTDTANYRDNLATGEPRLWVVLRAAGPEPPVEVLAVTADPAEGEAATEAGSNIVETLAMPREIAGAIAAYVAAHHVERPLIKRKRGEGEPDPRRQGRGADGARQWPGGSKP
jgi:hypothetical protein